MGRKPVHLLPAGGLAPQDQIWTALRRLRGGTLREIAYEAKAVRATTRDYLRRLELAGIVSREIRDRVVHYRLERDMGVETPRLREDGTPSTSGRGREAMWRTMRVLKEFGVADLLTHARAAGLTVAEAEAETYCRWLYRAGYLVRSPRPSTVPRWHLVPARHTGPKPPMIQRIRQVYDPNLGQVVWREKELQTEEAS
ncbi:MAG: hypothetical protein CVU73_15865 [Deltaproteobacteria bacterium HGW-Deltaproteobacteria-8]|jgi:hypothetical protein|nr:MAG: hypothetical protein CVU73_15865 [Deltaproteobacteria bacterium HGW-Deltaproteobacteria-8]